MAEIKYVKDHKSGNRFYPIVKSAGIIDAFNINRPQIDCLFGKIISYSIDGEATEVKLRVGAKTTLSIDIVNEGPVDYDDIKWTSSNTKIATVDKGTITGLKNGTATIIAKSKLYDIYIEVPVTVVGSGPLPYWYIRYKSPVEVPHILEKVPEQIRKACTYHSDWCENMSGQGVISTYMGSYYDPESQYGYWYYTEPLVSTNMIASDALASDQNSKPQYSITYSYDFAIYKIIATEEQVQVTQSLASITELSFAQGLKNICPNFTSTEFTDLEKLELPESIVSLRMYSDLDTSATLYRPHPKTAKNMDYEFVVGPNVSSITDPQMSGYGGTGPAYDLQHFKYLSVHPNNPIFDSRDNCNAVIETATNTLRIGCSNTVIPPSVNKIGVAAFSGVQLANTTVTIPEHIGAIGGCAFMSSSIEELYMYGGSIIPLSCFGNCSKLHTIVLHSGITQIVQNAFSGVPCTSITFLGTMAQWQAISLPSSNQTWKPSTLTTVNCTDGVITL